MRTFFIGFSFRVGVLASSSFVFILCWGECVVVGGLRFLIYFLLLSITDCTTSQAVRLPGPSVGHTKLLVGTLSRHRSAHRCTSGTLDGVSLSSLL